MNNKEIVDKLVEFVKIQIVAGISQCYEEMKRLEKKNEEEVEDEELFDPTAWINSYIRSNTRSKFGEKFKKVFVKADEYTSNWEAVIVYDDNVIHAIYEATCVMVLGVKSVTTYSKVEAKGTCEYCGDRINKCTCDVVG